MIRKIREVILNEEKLGEDVTDAGSKATKYITSINSDTGVRVHAADDTQNYTQLDSDGMKVYKAGSEVASFGSEARIGAAAGSNVLTDSNGVSIRDGSTDLAKFGAEGMQIGKDNEKHIGITSTEFNVYDEDGSIPFYVSTGSSLHIQQKGAGSAIQGAGGTYYYWSTYVYIQGTLEDNQIKFGTSTSGYPSSYDGYVTLPSDGSHEKQSVTVNGIVCKAWWQTDATVGISFENTTNTKTFVAYTYTDRYYETNIKANDAILSSKFSMALLRDITGTSVESYCYMYTYGHIAHLHIGVYNTNRIPAGSVIYHGWLMNAFPQIPVVLCGEHYAGETIVGRISSDGEIYVCAPQTTAISSSSSQAITLSATYVFK